MFSFKNWCATTYLKSIKTIFLRVSYVCISPDRPHEPLPPEAGPVDSIKWGSNWRTYILLFLWFHLITLSQKCCLEIWFLHECWVLPDDGEGEVRVGGRQRVEALRVAERVVLQRVQSRRVLPTVPGELQAVTQCCCEISSWKFTFGS